MITFKRLSELSVEDAVALWNRGFEGYFVNISMTVNTFIRRTGFEDISLEHSLAAYCDSQAVGFVANGFRQAGGQKIAWNGGTGVVPEYRGKGVGLSLMENNLKLYEREGVQLATLEALIQNERAIRLYEKVGYNVVDRLVFLQHTGSMSSDAFKKYNSDSRYLINKGLAREIGSISFYKSFAAWQTQWPSLKDGESILISDGEEAVGYTLYKRIYDDAGNLATIALYQCEALPGRQDEEDIICLALQELFQPLDVSCKRMTINLRTSNETVIQVLSEAGFSTEVEQVYMTKRM